MDLIQSLNGTIVSMNETVQSLNGTIVSMNETIQQQKETIRRLRQKYDSRIVPNCSASRSGGLLRDIARGVSPAPVSRSGGLGLLRDVPRRVAPAPLDDVE